MCCPKGKRNPNLGKMNCEDLCVVAKTILSFNIALQAPLDKQLLCPHDYSRCFEITEETAGVSQNLRDFKFPRRHCH